MDALDCEPEGLCAVDLTSPATHADDLSAVWDRLRESHPLAWHPLPDGGGGFWVVSTHRLATEVYRDSKRFTSINGNVLATLLRGGDSAGGEMLAVSDGPRHQQIRRELLRFFTPQALGPIRDRIARCVRDLVSGVLAGGGECDFAADVAERIPLAAICDLLEVPEEDRAVLYTHSSSALAAVCEDTNDLDARLSRIEILMYFAKLVRGRTRLPGAGLLSRLIDLCRAPLALSEDELLANCYSLLLGGDESTRFAIIGAVKAFAEHPEQWYLLRERRVPVETAVEELLRWTTPTMHGGRTAVRDTQLLDRCVYAGQIVTVWNSSANFDPLEFAAPRQLQLSRRPNRHLSFAYGPHFCLGAQLARVELSVLMEVLVDLVDEIHLADAPQPIYSNFLNGFHSLPVRLVARNSDRRRSTS
jgi:cytochrome P450